MFSSPSRGSYISTVNGVAYTLNATEAILVPFPGFLYLYNSHCYYYSNCHRSRPLPGVLISLRKIHNNSIKDSSSRPLPGVLISLRYIRLFRRILGVVLVPFPGFLYLYSIALKLYHSPQVFSSPSRGSYISTKC